MNDVIMKCTGLWKNYGMLSALRGVDLEISAGRIVGLLGPNGSGKTTLLKIANGLLTPSAGRIEIGGMDIGVGTRKIVSYLPDCDALPDHMRVGELVGFYSDFYDDLDRDRAFAMLDELGVAHLARLKTLSKGNREKVQLVLVMSRRARLYLLDEPIGGVDPAARENILNTIISNYSPDSAVVISTHLISDVEKVLDDVIFISGGEIRLYDTAENIRQERGMSVDALFREEFRC